nr:T-cell differentiation antigen CD6 isoform X2 [Misgurnus anguillicaudatus]
MSPLLLYTVLQTLSLSQGLGITHDLPRRNLTKPADNSAIGLSMLSLSRGCSGILRARHRDTTVDVTLNLLDAQKQKYLADQVCQSLGCGQNHVVNATDHSDVCLANCILKESKLHNCTTTANGNCTNATKVICEHQVVRLAEGQDRCVGRVELLDTGKWGTVCDDDFNDTSGNVVCAQLDCGIMIKYGFWGAGSGPIHISKMKCNGTEDNLWECNVNKSIPRDYCGHKEDVGIVCSESTVLTSTTSNTTPTVFTKWTTESSTEAATVAGASPAVIGCIILSIALLLLVLSNAAVCVHFRRRKVCEIEQHHTDSQESTDYHQYTAMYNPQPTTTAQRYESLVPRQSSNYGSRLDQSPHNSICSSDSNYRHHNRDQAQQLHLHNLPGDEIPSHVDTISLTPLATRGAELPITQSQAKDLSDSSSTSSGEFYENTDKTDVDNIQKSQDKEASLEKSPLMSLSNYNQHLPPTENANDLHSISSGEVYENTAVDIDDDLQPENEGSPSLPEQSLQTPHDIQMTGNAAGYGGTHSQDGNDSDSTSSDECYQNIELDADASLQSGKESPPETSLQTPLNHHNMTGSTVGYEDHHIPRKLSQEADSCSTSSENSYVNVPPRNASDDESSPAECSSDSEYDQPENW